MPATAEPALAESMKLSWQDADDRPSMPEMLIDHLLKSHLVSSADWDKEQTSLWLKRHGVPDSNGLFDDLEGGSDLHTLVGTEVASGGGAAP